MIGLGELTQHRTINRGVRNTFDVRGNHLERREAAHQRAHIVLVHDDEVPEWILCTCCINRNDAGLELFYRIHHELTVDRIAGKVEALSLSCTFKNDPAGFFR